MGPAVNVRINFQNKMEQIPTCIKIKMMPGLTVNRIHRCEKNVEPSVVAGLEASGKRNQNISLNRSKSKFCNRKSKIKGCKTACILR